jgi:hypothetical protein
MVLVFVLGVLLLVLQTLLLWNQTQKEYISSTRRVIICEPTKLSPYDIDLITKLDSHIIYI